MAVTERGFCRDRPLCLTRFLCSASAACQLQPVLGQLGVHLVDGLLPEVGDAEQVILCDQDQVTNRLNVLEPRGNTHALRSLQAVARPFREVEDIDVLAEDAGGCGGAGECIGNLLLRLLEPLLPTEFVGLIKCTLESGLDVV